MDEHNSQFGSYSADYCVHHSGKICVSSGEFAHFEGPGRGPVTALQSMAKHHPDLIMCRKQVTALTAVVSFNQS
jgi:hypothetical protein